MNAEGVEKIPRKVLTSPLFRRPYEVGRVAGLEGPLLWCGGQGLDGVGALVGTLLHQSRARRRELGQTGKLGQIGGKQMAQ